MSFRQKCVKNIIGLGLFFVILQILLSTKFDRLKVVYQNSSLPKVNALLNQIYSSRHFNESFSSSLVFSSSANGTKIVSLFKENRHGHEGHNGFELAAAARNICIAEHIHVTGTMKNVHAVLNKRVLYCPMEKIGTTFWRRVFHMMVAKDAGRYKQPYDVPIKTALGQSKAFTFTLSSAKVGSFFSQNSFSFLFVRNPYSRLLSAFIDKVVPPNPTYWNAFGVKAKAMFRPGFKAPLPVGRQKRKTTNDSAVGHDVTFAEFVKFVVAVEKSGKGIDPHFVSISKGCRPCAKPYTYVGRMETFKDDSLFVMHKLGFNTSASSFESRFSDLSLDDAITDSIRSPFEWKRDVIKFISWGKALQRIWLKLQMRGIIERSIKLDISDKEVDKINVNQFIDMARKANKESNPEELKKQKDLAKREAFASVHIDDIKAFRDTFIEDFKLFGYDLEPLSIFNRDAEPVAPSSFFDYSHLN